MAATGVFLGVDGGGTKTAFALISDRGEVLSSALEGSCYYLGRGFGVVEDVLAAGVRSVCAGTGLSPDRIDHAFVGLPGYGEVSADVEALDAIPGRVLGHRRYGTDNDVVAGWAGSLGGVDGVHVVAGTGSIAYGEHRGRRLRVGGWGEVFDDVGSAYWIAVRGLAAFARMSDGRLPAGPLHRRLAEHLGLRADLDLVDVVLNRWRGDRATIAGLARQVSAAAEAGDGACSAILREAGRELADLVRSTAAQLDHAGGPVSWSGGVFASAGVRAAFRAELAGVELREPLLPPVLGAGLYAARLAGRPLDAGAVTALRTGA